MKRTNHILAAAVLAALSSGALAEEATLEEIQVKAQPDKPGLNLKKTNSTSNRLGLTAQETPASIETLDIQTIRQRGDISVREAVTRTTGITDISTPGNGQSFSSRGFAGNNSVAQAEDGVRLMTGAGTLTYPSDTWGYERIEVLRGPASVLFGDGSSGGIVNSIRKQASREASIEALVGAGSYGAYRAALGGTGAISEIGAFRIDASVLGGDGYISRGDYDSKKIMTSLLFTPTDHLRIGFTLDHAKDSPTANFGAPLRNGKINHALRSSNYNVTNNEMEFEDTRARAKIEWNVTEHLQLKNEAYWFKSDREWQNAENYALNSITNTVTQSTFLAITHGQKQIGNRFEIIHSDEFWEHQNRFSAGWEISRSELHHASNAGNTASNVIPLGADTGLFLSTTAVLPNYNGTIRQQAFFAEDAFNLNDRWKLIAGVRKEFIHSDREDFRNVANEVRDKFSPVTWRLGTVLEATDNTNLYGQISKGTDPITNLLGLNLANSQFDLTRSRQAEVGIKQSLENIKGEWTLALYHIAKDNIITQDPITPSISVQGGKQSSRGIEYSTTLYPVEHWRLDFNAALLNARYDELREGGAGISRAGNTPTNVPEKVANAWVYYQAPEWEAGIGARYIGKRYANNANDISLAAYTVYDASAAWHVNKQMTLRANIRNLTDKFYAALAYGSTQQIVGAPRQLELTAEFRY
ncbi:TonB-dependent receptor [Methylobacillus arboreus]|uniref:TonB-dependent receptor n=1 Tax=Methylobacillus arboreus TaxID=755170 RepID=UPI001E55B73E|nr:TonB-dependent receptor [Methylobacillus arboreus]MCB5190119.1 TonB-dependent receptor [Methylobacillus arboreus]